VIDEAFLGERRYRDQHRARPVCGFRRMRTVIPIDCGQRFRSIADSVPVIADSGSRRQL